MEKVINYAFIFLLLAVIVVSVFLSLDGMLSSSIACDSGTYNASARSCWNGSDNLDTDLSYGGNATHAIQEGLYETVSLAPTWGVLIGVSILLAIIAGGFIAYRFAGKKGYL